MRLLVVALFLLVGCESAPTEVRPLVLVPSAGDSQVVKAGYPAPITPAVTVTRNSEAVQGVEVTFTFPPVRGLFTDAIVNFDTVVTSDASGMARLPIAWTMRSSIGEDSISASAPGAAPIVFHAMAVAGTPYGFLKVAGDSQTAPAGTALTTMPTVKVIDEFGNGVPGVSVYFSVVSGGGSITGAAQVTDQGGVAALGSWKLGSTPGANTITALIQSGAVGIPFAFTATGTAEDSDGGSKIEDGH